MDGGTTLIVEIEFNAPVRRDHAERFVGLLRDELVCPPIHGGRDPVNGWGMGHALVTDVVFEGYPPPQS